MKYETGIKPRYYLIGYMVDKGTTARIESMLRRQPGYPTKLQLESTILSLSPVNRKVTIISISEMSEDDYYAYQS